MSWLSASQDEEYIEALKATEFLGVPAEGFKRVEEGISVAKAAPVLVKQNNILIYLLIKILHKLEKLES